jgi:hypothetical protein
MDYNIRPKPSLIDPSLLGKINKVYIGKQSENHFFLDWIYKGLYPYFKDNFIFSIVVVGLIIYLIYRYLETIKKKNRIIQNINADEPIAVKIDKPIDYNNTNDEKFTNSELTDLDSPQNQEFDKDIEQNLKMSNIQELNNLPPELVRQQIMQQQMTQGDGMMNRGMMNQGMMNQGMMNQGMDPSVYMGPTPMTTNLQRNMNQLQSAQPTCGGIRPPRSMYEPMANNTYSDNFMDF